MKYVPDNVGGRGNERCNATLPTIVFTKGVNDSFILIISHREGLSSIGQC